jgi:hypothetical protein
MYFIPRNHKIFLLSEGHAIEYGVERIFGPKRDEVTGRGRNYILRGLTICTSHPIFFG